MVVGLLVFNAATFFFGALEDLLTTLLTPDLGEAPVAFFFGALEDLLTTLLTPDLGEASVAFFFGALEDLPTALLTPALTFFFLEGAAFLDKVRPSLAEFFFAFAFACLATKISHYELRNKRQGILTTTQSCIKRSPNLDLVAVHLSKTRT